jgi:hypothetical protein
LELVSDPASRPSGNPAAKAKVGAAPKPRPAPESASSAKSKPEPPAPKPVPGSAAKSGDWKLAAFERVSDFVERAREIMSAMVVENGYAAIEDYPGYVLLRDAARYAISLGEGLEGPGVDARLALLRKGLEGEITIEKLDGTG